MFEPNIEKIEWPVIEEKAKFQITVAQLILQLKAFPSNALIYVEGCDCIGEGSGATYDPNDNTVLVERIP